MANDVVCCKDQRCRPFETIQWYSNNMVGNSDKQDKKNQECLSSQRKFFITSGHSAFNS